MKHLAQFTKTWDEIGTYAQINFSSDVPKRVRGVTRLSFTFLQRPEGLWISQKPKEK